MLKNIMDYLMNFIKPSFYLGGLDYVMSVWREADTHERIILLLVFSPMFITAAGLVVSIVYFALFVLPIFLFRLLSWGILTALFGMAGRFGYKYFTGRSVDFPVNKNLNRDEDVIIDVKYHDTKTRK